MKRIVSLWLEAYLDQRRKKHGMGPRDRMGAIFISCCYVGVAIGDHRWHPYYGPAIIRRFWSWYYRDKGEGQRDRTSRQRLHETADRNL